MELNLEDIIINKDELKSFAKEIYQKNLVSSKDVEVYDAFLDQGINIIKAKESIYLEIEGVEIVKEYLESIESNAEQDEEIIQQNLEDEIEEILSSFRIGVISCCEGDYKNIDTSGKISLHTIGLTIAEDMKLNPFIACSLLQIFIEQLKKKGRTSICKSIK